MITQSQPRCFWQCLAQVERVISFLTQRWRRSCRWRSLIHSCGQCGQRRFGFAPFGDIVGEHFLGLLDALAMHCVRFAVTNEKIIKVQQSFKCWDQETCPDSKTIWSKNLFRNDKVKYGQKYWFLLRRTLQSSETPSHPWHCADTWWTCPSLHRVCISADDAISAAVGRRCVRARDDSWCLWAVNKWEWIRKRL